MEAARTTAPAAPELACPACGGGLRATDMELVCERHGAMATRSQGGVLEFDRSDAYWGEIDRDLMRRINAAARDAGWRAALERHLAPTHPDLVPYVSDAARADWRVLLPLRRERTVGVDVGAGWGANSFGLLPHVARLYAVEKTAERVEFLALRGREERGGGELVPVRADLHALPFAPGSIDVFIVNGVLEWAGLVDPDAGTGRRRRSPRVLQERFLARLWTLLRPRGWLYVGIENRFGRMFWHGVPDHQGLRYTSLLPKPVARVYTRLRAATSPRTHRIERDYRTWIYSFGGYARLLQRCGFVEIERHAVVPGYNQPTLVVPLASPGPLVWLATRSRSPHRGRGRLGRAARIALAQTGLEARIASCYALVARRPD